ncbi:Reverse transcriptase Ty1/copia-type domain-containing protein [Abeliophyllum distichum]|uniref:Reverse transcriptase Ty1/copia-type domain-containing protein n=1 Tax=Abeliophyllum distichum TaxID=126358 RepID=A0ABD1NWI3_9LAMI
MRHRLGKGEPPILKGTPALCKSSKVIHFLQRYNLLITSNVLLIEEEEPTTYVELKSIVDSKRWQEAIESEMNSMYENKVWTLVDPLEGVKPIGYKFVYEKKIDMDGNVHTYKISCKELQAKIKN